MSASILRIAEGMALPALLLRDEGGDGGDRRAHCPGISTRISDPVEEVAGDSLGDEVRVTVIAAGFEAGTVHRKAAPGLAATPAAAPGGAVFTSARAGNLGPGVTSSVFEPAAAASASLHTNGATVSVGGGGDDDDDVDDDDAASRASTIFIWAALTTARDWSVVRCRRRAGPHASPAPQAKLFEADADEARIIALLRPLLHLYSRERRADEHFGDFVIRAGVVAPTTNGRNFHEAVGDLRLRAK